MNDVERFWSWVDKTDDCWLWTGSLVTYGYGYFKAGNKNFRAHRYSYELSKGKIPEGLVIDHLCRNHGCVNPDHLEAVTNRENILRGIGITARCAKVTHCPKGHEYNEKNTYHSPKRPNGRDCRICRTAAAYRHTARKRKEAKC